MNNTNLQFLYHKGWFSVLKNMPKNVQSGFSSIFQGYIAICQLKHYIKIYTLIKIRKQYQNQ